MDLKILHFKCQSVVRHAFEDFKHYINNAIFEVDDSIIEIELATMKQTIKANMNAWFMDGNYSNKQYIYMQRVLASYKTIAIKVALRYAKKQQRLKC